MKRTIALVLALNLALAAPLMCGPQGSLRTSAKDAIQTQPASIGEYIFGKNVELMTRDATYVKGKVTRATPEEIVIRVKKAEPKNRINSREAIIRAADISVINTKRSNTALAVGLGVLGGMCGAGAIARAADPDAANQGAIAGLALGAMALGATGGVFLGKRISQKTIVILVSEP
jgi:hypothetical protein